eukprot:802360-Prymnesium_polylepis.1
MFARASRFIERIPLSFAVAYGGAKTAAADVMVQKWVEHRDELDRKRVGTFLVFGLVQVGFVQYQLYCNLFPRLFPSSASFSSLSIQQKLADAEGLRNVVKQASWRHTPAILRILGARVGLCAWWHGTPRTTCVRSCARVRQVCLDQFVYHPFCYFPVFYVCQEIVTGASAGPVETVSQAVTKCAAPPSKRTPPRTPARGR